MTAQEQFLDVIDRDEAERRFRVAIALKPLGEETIPLREALGRVLAQDVLADVDVPSFDRSNYDGFAVRACDTFGAEEETPRTLELLEETLAPGIVPRGEIKPGVAMTIATGAMLPRGADGVVMVEHTEVEGSRKLVIRKAISPGFGVSFAGTDVAAGEIVLRRGELLTSRETGVLAAIGVDKVTTWRRPKTAILSTGDELIAPGEPMTPGMVYDSNAQILADAVRELGGEPLHFGIVRDDLDELRSQLHDAIAQADVVLLSGGTSKGEGDLCYRAVEELDDPGVVVHGVALKPGKPICLAATHGKPVVILPGFPTSAIFTFHEFVAPVLRILAGRPAQARSTLPAKMAVKVNSEIGRTEFLLVGLVQSPGAETVLRTPQSALPALVAYPMGKGSGSVTTFSRADGFVTIGQHEEIVEAGSIVDVQLLGQDLRLADLVVIGSHCVGLDYLLGRLHERGFQTKFLAVGSTAGLYAARRGECDVAGVHLLDPVTGQYNRPFLNEDLELEPGYGRRQGVLFRQGDERFESQSVESLFGADVATLFSNKPPGNRRPAIAEFAGCMMVNRNAGSGTRLLIDRLLGDAQPPGYPVAARSHNAVAAAIAQHRADWGVAIEWTAKRQGLSFLPLTDEQFDFIIPRSRYELPAVRAFRQALQEADVQQRLSEFGFTIR